MKALVLELPARELVPLGLAVFALFALLGPLVDIQTGGRMPTSVMLRNAAVSGLFALGYGFGFMRRKWWLLGATLAAQVAWVVAQAGGERPLPSAPDLARLRIDARLAIALMIVSYVSFLSFINGTASRYLRVRAEIDLAHQIHQVLVPSVATRIGDFEFAGFSQPSGEVGGDLVDVVDADGGWFGYVADVSGHGVSSGVVMGMFKSALRMRLRQAGPIGALLDDLNVVLVPLKSSSMYVTVACVRAGAGDTVEYAVAGHLPILRAGASGVDEMTTPQIPIGMFEDYRFTSASMAVARGEVLALITDGLTEVFDKNDRELGLERVKALLAAGRTRPLRETADAIVAAARGHGAQLDDQTLLLIRRT